MWTPRRLLILLSCFASLIAGFVGYNRLLGGLNGLAPLPYAFLPGDASDYVPPQLSIETKFQEVFGNDCPELNWKIKVDVPARGVILAAEDFKIEDDLRRVRLSPLSIAIGKKPPPRAPGETAHRPGDYPEVNVLKGQVAYLYFDGPVSNPIEMGKRKITAAQLGGHVEISNNRKTPQRSDDLTLYIDDSIVYYEESAHRIWTDGPVKLEDLLSKPEPMRCTALGLDILLAQDTLPSRKPAGVKPEAKPMGFGGITNIKLRSQVFMQLFVDDNADFLANASSSGANVPVEPANNRHLPQTKPVQVPTPTAPPARAKLTIRTPGSFHFDAQTYLASFEKAGGKPTLPEVGQDEVVVERRLPYREGKVDRLQCEKLDLQFRRAQPEAAKKERNKPATPPNPANRPEDAQDPSGMEIETVHATGKEVVLSSEVENFTARGNDFYFAKLARKTVLKGNVPEGMYAIKDGNEIRAREIHIVQSAEGPLITALGPGFINPLDKNTGKRLLSASWQKELVTSRVDGIDLLVLTGNAKFEDKQVDPPRSLQAETLKVWLVRKDQKQPTPSAIATATSTGGEAQGGRIKKLEGRGKVSSQSEELIVREADHLIVHFEDRAVPLSAGPTVTAPVVKQNPVAQPTTVQKNPEDGPFPLGTAKPFTKEVPTQPATTITEVTPTNPAPNANKQPARPLELSAREVLATIVRTGNKTELSRAWTEGKVRVYQAPGKEGEKGIEIKGDMLDLEHTPQGSILDVRASDHDEDSLVSLQFNELLIVGEKVILNQVTNVADVTGRGCMQIDSTTSLSGQKLDKAVPLVIFWQKQMIFNGNLAEFTGDVAANQGKARLACQSMQVWLDRSLTLKQGEKNTKGTKVQQMVCSKNVWVEDSAFEAGKLVKYQRIECPELMVDNENGVINASGPGVVRTFQPGSNDTGLGPKLTPTDPKKTPAELMKLTRVTFSGKLFAKNKEKELYFYSSNGQGIEVYHLPASHPDIDLNFTTLPPGCLLLRSNQLQVKGIKDSQNMSAQGRVQVEANDFSGRGEVVTFDEAKDQIILEGGENGKASLIHRRGKDLPPDQADGSKITYLLKLGTWTIDRTTSIRGN